MKNLNIKAVFVVSLLTLSLPITYAQSFLTNGLVAYYPFNGNASDASGNGNNGTIHGGVVSAPDRFGYPDSAYAFNGVDGYIDIGNPVGNSPTNLTECAWVKIISRATSGYGLNDVIITKRQDPSGALPVYWATLFVSPSGNGVLSDEGGFHETDCVSTTQTPTNVWVFLCGVVSNGTYQIYINGVLENTMTDGTPLYSTNNMYLMHDVSWGTYCNGAIDDVRIYNRALSSNEVAQLYTFQSGEFCSPHAAEATAQVVNGFMVGATLTDIGCGYTNNPLVLIEGGGGSGAIATATVQNGFVTSINIINPGSGYTNLPDILIASPPFVPTLSINVSRVMVTLHVVLGLNYVLESSSDMINWTATGPQFTAQSEVITNEFVVSQTGQFFRVRQVP
jgi:Concanavalin A-like lectin/glucanases superfamily